MHDRPSEGQGHHQQHKRTSGSGRGQTRQREDKRGRSASTWKRTAEAPPGPEAQPDKRESNGRTPTAAPGSFGIHEAAPERQHPPAPHKARLLSVRLAERPHSASFPFSRVFHYLTPESPLCPLRGRRKHETPGSDMHKPFSLQKLLSLFFLDSSFFSFRSDLTREYRAM